MKKNHLQSLILQLIYKVFCRSFLKLFVGVDFADSGFLLEEKQFIIVANHNSHLDTISLLASLPSGILWRVKPVAAEDYFGRTRWMAACSNYFINTLLIQRKGNKEGHDPIQRMLDTLDKGYSLILFPEGTRGEPEQMEKIKPGIARILSARPGLTYVPVFMTGMGKSLPKGRVIVLPYKSAVHYGKPTLPESTHIEEILEQINQDFVQMSNQYQPVGKVDEED